jgi:uncharacterized protein (DUF885 family)
MPVPVPRRWIALLSTLVLLIGLAPAAGADAATDTRFRKLGDAYIEGWLARHPNTATRLGVHKGDDQLPAVTQASIAEEIAWFHRLRDERNAIPRARLSFQRALEYDLLGARIERELLDLEVIRPWERNPNAYLDLVAASVQSLLQRDFAPPCSRVRSATRRLAQVPEVLRAARINLKNPPRIATEVAIGQFQGALRLYREVVPALSERCSDAKVQADLAEADSSAIRAVESFIAYLKDDLLPASNGEYALGREVYQRKLAADEMETTPVDSLLARANASLEETRARMVVVAEKIAPGLGVRAALDSLTADRPDADMLVPFVSAQLDKIRGFLRAKDLLTLPEKEHLIVRETPVYRRSTSFASMESPGVWEKNANEAYYNVTPVEPGWTEKQKRDHLGFFNRWSSEIVSVHEALPGHYYQFLAVQRVPSRLRQVLGCGSNSEGWAHYCEQMAIEEGYGGGDPRYELAQLVLAIQRLGRFVVGISLHTQGMSYEQAVQVFEDRCWMAPVNAEREARRGTMDPTYLVYTLGKWRVLEMREELKRRLGDRYRLKDFHDAFLREGPAALPVVRASLLHTLAAPSTRKAR